MISNAYNHEDVLLHRAFKNCSDGCFVDIGAHHPEFDSVTKHFSDLGWRGINVEPIPGRARLFAVRRPGDINLSAGVSDCAGNMSFHEVVNGATLSTFSDELADKYRRQGYQVVEHRVPVLTLAEVFGRHVTGTVEFLCIDVEGHERQVLAGGDFSQWRPKVVVVESTWPGTSIPSHEQWEHILLDANYIFATFDGVNRYYVRQEDRGLIASFSTPVNVCDGFVPYRQAWLEQELERYRTLNPIRRMGSWIADVRRAAGRKLRSRSA